LKAVNLIDESRGFLIKGAIDQVANKVSVSRYTTIINIEEITNFIAVNEIYGSIFLRNSLLAFAYKPSECQE